MRRTTARQPVRVAIVAGACLSWAPAAHASDEPGVADPTPADAVAHGSPEMEIDASDGVSDAEAEGLAAKLQNPIADLISVPFQLNVDSGAGPDGDADRVTLNIQPVIPFRINEDWNVISRTIVPVISAEGPVAGVDDATGLGDTLQSFFISPREKVGGWVLGAGPAALIPTGTDDLFRTKQFALGPTLIGLRQDRVGEGTLTYGMLANHLWKVAGSDDTSTVNASFLQPFVSYTFPTATSLTLNAEATYDWTAGEWEVPLNLFVSQLMPIGGQPVQFQVGGRYFADTIGDGPEWGLRFTFTLLFPR